MTDIADIATTAVADVQESFKRVYLMAVNAVPDATPLTAQLQRTRKFRAGPDGLYFSAKMETGGAVANVGDGQMLPRPTKPKRKQGKIGLAHTYTVVAVGGQSIPLTDSTRDAFVSNLEEQLEDGMIRVRNDLERQYNGDGRGILAIVETVASAPTYDVFRPYGDTGAPAGVPGTMLFIEDMDVAFINPAGGAERGRAKLVSIDIANDRITLSSSPAGGAIGDYVVLCNDSAITVAADKANNYLGEAAGIGAVVQSGDTFENISGVTYRRWNGNRLGNGGVLRDVSEKLIATAEARTKARSGKKPDLFYTTRGVSIILQDQLAGRRRDTSNSVKLRGGYDGVEIGGRTIVEGDWCKKGSFYGINTDRTIAGMADLVPMGYVDLDGAKLHRIEGRHSYRADLWFAHQGIWFARAAHFELFDLNDDYTILR